ncbi:hypothetical protein ACWEOG_15160 [Amycolatopsis japonica]
MGWDRFEQLVLAVASAELGIGGVRVRRYGTPGQAQHGVDLAGREPDRSYTIIQCKEYQTFTPADLKTAVDTFAKGRQPFRAKRFIVATSASSAPTQLNDALAALQDMYPTLELDLWGSEQINEHLRYLADVVARFWGGETAEKFCIGVGKRGTQAPPVDRRTQAERVLIGPLNASDVAPLLQEAKRSSAAAPDRAADLYGRLADRLSKENFRGHAQIVRRHQLEALSDAGRHSQAITLAGELAVTALESCDRRTASELTHLAVDIERLATESDLDNAARKRQVELMVAASEAAHHPVGLADRLWQCLATEHENEPPFQPSLILLLAETVFGLEPDRLPELDSLLEGAIRRTNDLGTSRTTELRLQLVQAEYDVDQRVRLLRSARTRQLPGILAALVNAREARRCCLDGLPDEASEAWRNAVNDAIQAGYNADAADWLYAIRDMNVKYGPWNESLDDEHRLAQALRATSSGRRLLHRVRSPREAAMATALARVPIEAAVWGRRWLIDAATTGSWSDENDATLFLGDLYRDHQEPTLAAGFYQRTGSEKKLADLIRSVKDTVLPLHALTDSPWWVLNTRIAQVAAQADLLDDDTATDALDRLLDLMTRGRAGELVDSPNGTLTLSAAEAACDLADRGTAEQASALLAILAADVPREPSHFSPTDKKHAEACVRIIERHPSLALQALNRLLDLAEQNAQHAQKLLTQSRVYTYFADGPEPSTLSTAEQATLRDRIAVLVQEGIFLAAVVLRSAAPNHPLVHGQAQKARARVLARADPEPGHIDFFTSLPRDAYVASALPPTDVRDCLEKVLSIAADHRETALNRHEALVSAIDLLRQQDLPVKQRVFSFAREFATGDRDGSHLDGEVTGEGHPLSSFNVNFGTSSLRGYGLLLAKAAATKESEESWVRDQAVTMLRSDDSDDLHAAADVLAMLSDSVSSTLDLTLLVNHHAINVRQACAVLCTRNPERYQQLMLTLASDPEYRVRAVLASAFSRLPEADRAGLTEVQDRLASDPRHSVRAALSR